MGSLSRKTDWSKEEFTKRFFTLYDTMTSFIRKYHPGWRKRVTNESQLKHTRRRRQ